MMSEETMLAVRAVLVVGGIVGTLLVTVFGLLLRHQFSVNKLLFIKIDKLQRQVNVLKLAALKNDPEGTALFNALSGGDKDHD